MEQRLGHITHSQNLARWLLNDQSVQPILLHVPPEANDIWEKLPGVSFRLGLRAWELVRTALRKETLDCLLYHTQGTALFSLGLSQRIPTVISLDATPMNFYTHGDAYGYDVPGGILDQLKFKWYQKMFQSTTALVTWSNWAKESLVQDYGVVPDKVNVIPPGVDLCRWRPTVKEVGTNPLRLLFVGGDFTRKGGHALLDAFQNGLTDRCTLDIVTKDEVVCPKGPVRVHRGLTPNSPLLQQLYAEAVLFVFPTLADFTPIAVMEAMASGLPVVTTNVGALAEQVEDGINGFLVPPNDSSAIVKVVSALADNPRQLVRMGTASRTRAERFFDGERNYKALVDLLKQCVDKQRIGKQMQIAS